MLSNKLNSVNTRNSDPVFHPQSGNPFEFPNVICHQYQTKRTGMTGNLVPVRYFIIIQDIFILTRCK
jgi:hypothetical protein